MTAGDTAAADPRPHVVRNRNDRVILGLARAVRPWHAAVAALMFMMGFGALHEIMEYMSYLLLGEERGMLKPSTSYFFDTQRDLSNNLLGTLTAIALLALARLVRRQGQRLDGAGLAAVDEQRGAADVARVGV